MVKGQSFWPLQFYNDFSKKLESNYDSLKGFLGSNDIDEVTILGHTILGVDEPYYRDVLIPKLKA